MEFLFMKFNPFIGKNFLLQNKPVVWTQVYLTHARCMYHTNTMIERTCLKDTIASGSQI